MNRAARFLSHVAPVPTQGLSENKTSASQEQALKECREALRKKIYETNWNPILVRLAWHDSGTYDQTIKEWSRCGGANGSIRFDEEMGHGANAGLKKCIRYLQEVKDTYPSVSWSDLFQMASAVAIEVAGGPKIPMRYGRVDAGGPVKEGNLPGAGAPFPDESKDAPSHLRKVFYRMGFNDQEIVALSGAHTLGRAFKERSGTTSNGYGDSNATAFTCPVMRARTDGKEGVGMSGGRSWTQHWLAFNNEYFNRASNPQDASNQLLWLETDACLFSDPSFKEHTIRYANDQSVFFKEYAAAHKKLSELGSKFQPPQGIYLD